MDNKCSRKVIIINCIMYFLFGISLLYILFNKNKCELPIDYSNKILDDCYLTLHNLISIQFSNHSNYNSTVKTYIYSASKPFLIELLNNSTDDCLCCPTNFNEHLKI